MASLVGHVLGAAVAWELGRGKTAPSADEPSRGYLWAAIVAVLPDLDVIPPLIWPSLRGIHRSASHSLLAAAVIAAAVAFLASRTSTAGFSRCFRGLLPCALVHPILDWFMSLGPPVAFLWPITSEGWLSPVQLVPTAYYPVRWEGISSILFDRMTWVGILLEIVSIGSLLAAARGRVHRRWSFFAVAAAGFVLVWLLYAPGGPLRYGP